MVMVMRSRFKVITMKKYNSIPCDDIAVHPSDIRDTIDKNITDNVREYTNDNQMNKF